MNIPFYEDELGGSWIRVTHEDVYHLGLQFKVKSPNSRITPRWVYLDAAASETEGVGKTDAARFIIEVKRNNPGNHPHFSVQRSEKSSIRRLSVYHPARLLYALMPGRPFKMKGDEESVWMIDKVVQRGRGRVYFRKVESVQGA